MGLHNVCSVHQIFKRGVPRRWCDMFRTEVCHKQFVTQVRQIVKACASFFLQVKADLQVRALTDLCSDRELVPPQQAGKHRVVLNYFLPQLLCTKQIKLLLILNSPNSFHSQSFCTSFLSSNITGRQCPEF